MEEIKVGEYGRTNLGNIIKFAWLEREGKIDNKKVILVDKMKETVDCYYYFKKDEIIVKHSKNIIDLIAVGDIVELSDVLNKDILYVWSERMIKAMKEDIENGIQLKSILTKEQYESMNYKVGE